MLLTTICLGMCSCGGGSASAATGDPGTPPQPNPKVLACPAGQEDVMQYFVLNKQTRHSQFMNGQPNPIYTEVFPDEDFATTGYWFWLKSAKAHGFDVKAFDQKYVYIRSTELTWTDNRTFKRFVHDLPISARCIPQNSAGPQIQVPDTTFQYFASCASYKSSQLGTSLNDLDAPVLMDAGGNVGQVSTRVLHYRYNCDSNFQNCTNEEQFFLGKGYGLWRWVHYKSVAVAKSSLMNDLDSGTPAGTLPCSNSYQ